MSNGQWEYDRYKALETQLKLFPCIMLDGVLVSVGKDVTYEQVLECNCKVDPDLLDRLKREHVRIKDTELPEDLFKL